MQDQPTVAGREPLEGHVERNAGAATERCEHRSGHRMREIGPQVEDAVGKRQLGIAEESRRVGANLHTKPFARLAPTERAVERKAVGRKRLEAAATLAAGEMLAVDDRFPALFRHAVLRAGDVHDSFPQRQRILDRAGDSGASFGLDNDAVDHDLDLVFAAAVDRRYFIERMRYAIDADAV